MEKNGENGKPFQEAGVTNQQVNAVKDTWESGIENMWNNKFDVIKDGRWRFPVKFDVVWVDPHHTVKVHPGPRRSSSTNWDTKDTGRVVAHEFGHLLGLFDEYAGGALDPGGTKDSGSIMGSTGAAAVPRSRHYTQYTDWLKAKSPTQTFTVEPHVTGVDVVGSLSNFDVTYNPSSPTAPAPNDFELKLKGVKKDDIRNTFPGYGHPPTVTEEGGGVKVRWAGGDIPAGQQKHFGVRLKRGVNAEGAETTWTKDGEVVALNTATGVQQYWTADASGPTAIGSTIRNLSDQTFWVSTRFSQPLSNPVPLDNLTRDLVVPWTDFALFNDPAPVSPGDFLPPDVFELAQVGDAVVAQLLVYDAPPVGFDPFVPPEPLVFFTNQGIGLESAPTHGLVTGDFNLDDNWYVDDLGIMQGALVDPEGYRDSHGLSPADLLELGDLDGDNDFDQTDVLFAFAWVPTDNTLDELIPEPAGVLLLALGALAWIGFWRRGRQV